ncbi:hypothetical protein NADFUDRAFT_82392 [Nadsonia fulvescens var. elongata DSM 6958]|uniref:Maintenance of telomere capping protein 6 n=1 Tax=Nadsonia fulvescens var. elongata DSM 6958 TaxID=857566 RepID=A0A1E3PMV7_9ASCO|nr:hypothetical protein NADFUDRAFT_82392 [Nadsonia fulvescens var. elongata DSM 6958]
MKTLNSLITKAVLLLLFIGQALSTSECAPLDLNLTTTWPSLQPNILTGRRAQRDISWNVSIDQLVYFHASLTSVVFRENGYIWDSISSIRDLLNVGVQGLIIDAYWNEGNSNWQLCPDTYPLNLTSGTSTEIPISSMGKVVCDNNITLIDILSEVSSYISVTDTDLETNIIQLHFNLHSLNSTLTPSKSENITSTTKTSLPSILSPSSNIYTDFIDPFQSLILALENNLPDRIYTPEDLYSDRQDGFLTYNSSGLSDVGYPLQHHFLIEAKKRVLAYLNVGDTFANSSYHNTEETAKIFFNSPSNFSTKNIDDTTWECLSLSPGFLSSVNSTGALSWRTVSDSPLDSFTYNQVNLLSCCGLSPLLNHSPSNITDLIPLVSNSLWSWAPGEPASCQTTFNNNYKNTSISGENTNISAYNCAILNSSGWNVENCYKEHYPLCRKGELAYEWIVGTQKVNYFNAENSCPDGTSFSIPRTALQNMAAKISIMNTAKENNDDKGLPVWIDMNSISVSDCWVSGGTSAICPYRVISRNRDALVLLTVTGAVIFVILLIGFLLNLDKVPIKKNRHKWRKLINKFSENEYEGVPS